MPGFDRTGPSGAGPGSGRGSGPCGQTARTRRFPWSGLFRGMGRLGAAWGGGRNRRSGCGGWRIPFVESGSTVAIEGAEAIKGEIAAAKEKIAVMEARLRELETTGQR
jgi:hypothetical protein